MEDINLYRDIGNERNPASHTGKKMTANRLGFEDWDKALGILVRSSINAVENELTRRGFLIQDDLFTRKPVGKGIVVFQSKGNPWVSLLCSEYAWIDLDSEYRSFFWNWEQQSENLSVQLKTDVIYYYVEDDTPNQMYYYWQNGLLLEQWKRFAEPKDVMIEWPVEGYHLPIESLRVHSPPLGALVLSKKYWGFDTPLLAAG